MESTPVRSERCPRLTHDARCNHVIEAAVRLFAQKGFQGTKTKEIAEAAGVNEALIFRDFQTKEKLYCAILQYASRRITPQEWIEALTPHAERRDDEALFADLARQLFESFGRDPTLFRLMLYCALEQHELAREFRKRQIEPVERFIEEYMRTRQKEGAFPKADAHALAGSFLNMCLHYVLRQALFGQAEDAAERDRTQPHRMYARIFLDGVRKH
jgi:AcrR family transcriptional regulator